MHDHENLLHYATHTVETKEEIPMSATTNFFDNPMGHSGGSGWSAGVGGLIGAALGNGGLGGGLFGGNREQVATQDNLADAVAGIQRNMNKDQIVDRLVDVSTEVGDVKTAVGSAACEVKEAVGAASALNQLSLCNLGHAITSGFASTNQAILAQGAAARELALQQALDAERARATEMRIALSESKNQASHTSTQVILQQLLAK